MGDLGCRPWTNMWGEVLLVAFLIPLQWKYTSVNKEDHDLFDSLRSVCKHRVTCLTIPMLRSAMPSVSGWYGVVLFFSTPSERQNSKLLSVDTASLVTQNLFGYTVPSINPPVLEGFY